MDEGWSRDATVWEEGLFSVHRQEHGYKGARKFPCYFARHYFQNGGCQDENRRLSVIEL